MKLELSLPPAAGVGSTFCIEEIPREAGFVIFGASGDLTARKLAPALFNLHRKNRLPNGFYLVGCARSEYATDSFARTSPKRCAPSRRPRRIWPGFLERCYYLGGDYGDPALYSRLAALLAELDRRFLGEANHVFYLATPPDLYAAGHREARRCRDGPRPARRRGAGSFREALRAGPGQRHGPGPPPAHGAGRAPDLPHRPLPGQGNGAERPAVPLRQLDLRADLEPPLHRQRADHGGRNPGCGAPGRLLRPHRPAARHVPEPHAADARPGGHGAAPLLRRRPRARREDQAPALDPALPVAQRKRELRARPVRRLPAGARGGPGVHGRNLRGRPPGDRQLALGGGPLLPAGRQAPGAQGQRDRDHLQERAPLHVPAAHPGGPAPQHPHLPRAARGGHLPALPGQAARTQAVHGQPRR